MRGRITTEVVKLFFIALRVSCALSVVGLLFAGATEKIAIDYPAGGSVFPPEFPAPLFQWRDPVEHVTSWRIEITFSDGSRGIQVNAPGERMRVGETDPRCLGAIPPQLTPEQAAAHTWRPDARTWEEMKRRSVEHPATVTITGLRDRNEPASRGEMTFETSPDPVGAPVFYRDVPLIPTGTMKGVIKPLPPFAIGLIGWRLRNVAETKSRLLMEGVPTCANCHSFSRDGKTMGIDVDGPQNDKGLYALVPVHKQTSIRKDDVIRWSSFRGDGGGSNLRLGFMSQVSPDGQYVVTSINNRGPEIRGLEDKFFNAGYQNYSFGQVFYPTRGILAWYSKATGKLQPLPGADDPKYVHANATWSPDGKYLVFVRAEARDPYTPGQKMPAYANDPNETQIQYDLYRIPFNGGRGGRAEPVAGAGRNGMSNNFPKISPDGKWIVFVQNRNGLLMRPDSRLFIVSAEGGEARLMRCNTPLMNSWHSWSPNGRWLVFSSKSPSPYTQMYLTHIDENGNDTPPILIENATAANRSVNIPEFVNIPADGLEKMDAPATDFYKLFDIASDLGDKKQYEAAIATWKKALELNPDDSKAHSNLGILLATVGRQDEALAHYRKAVELEPEYTYGYTNLGVALARAGKSDEAVGYFEKALQLNPRDADAHSNLGAALAELGRVDEAIAHCQAALAIRPDHGEAHANLAIALARAGKPGEAIPHFERALAADPESATIHSNLAGAYVETGKFEEAIPHFRKALGADPNSAELHYYMATALGRTGKLAEAIPELEQAVKLTGGRQPQLLGTLAEVLAAVGRFPDALEAARRALALATEQNNAGLAGALKARIAFFESRATAK